MVPFISKPSDAIVLWIRSALATRVWQSASTGEIRPVEAIAYRLPETVGGRQLFELIRRLRAVGHVFFGWLLLPMRSYFVLMTKVLTKAARRGGTSAEMLQLSASNAYPVAYAFAYAGAAVVLPGAAALWLLPDEPAALLPASMGLCLVNAVLVLLWIVTLHLPRPFGGRKYRSALARQVRTRNVAGAVSALSFLLLMGAAVGVAAVVGYGVAAIASVYCLTGIFLAVVTIRERRRRSRAMAKLTVHAAGGDRALLRALRDGVEGRATLVYWLRFGPSALLSVEDLRSYTVWMLQKHRTTAGSSDPQDHWAYGPWRSAMWLRLEPNTLAVATLHPAAARVSAPEPALVGVGTVK